MLIHEARVGMIVEFGRENGEWTRGEIVKINPAKAKVKTLENRGSGRGSHEGAVWGVPYSMMRPFSHGAIKNPADEPFPYNPFNDDNLVMEAIVDVYARLSPEWLTCDGEKPRHQVIADKNRLERKLGFLFQALGRPVSEGVAIGWDMEKREKAQKKAQ